MQGRKLKRWVLPSILVILIIGLISLTAFISKTIYNSVIGDNYSYVLRDIKNTDIPVNKEVDDVFYHPFQDENVKVLISYYETNATNEEQEKSLIMYERTYMPNSGILYSSDKEFEVTSSLEGKVINVTKDDVLGNIVEVQHDNDLITKYSSLSLVDVQVGDNISSGEVIGMSGSNKISTKSQNMLLFELKVEGYTVNPNNYFDKSISEISHEN